MEKVVGKAWWVYKVKIVWSLLEADEKLLEEVNRKDRLENIIKSIQEEESRKEEILLLKACLKEEWKAKRKKVDSVMEVGKPDSRSVEMLSLVLLDFS